jgi:hypothetical protein
MGIRCFSAVPFHRRDGTAFRRFARPVALAMRLYGTFLPAKAFWT